MAFGSTNPKFAPTTGQQAQVDMVATAATHCMAYGGSRSSKTFGWCYVMALRAMARPSRHLIVRRHFKDVRQAIGMETWPEMMRVVFPGVWYDVNHTDWFITMESRGKDGKKYESVIWLGGLDNGTRTDKVLGREYSTIFINEASEILDFNAVVTLRSRLAEKSGLRTKFLYDQNPPSKAHWSYRETELNIVPGTKDERVLHPDDYASIQMNPDMNKHNLADGYIDRTLMAMPERQRRRFLFGLYADEVEDALWKFKTIDRYRIHPDDLPNMIYIVVSCDPAVTSNKDSDETGIVVVGKSEDKHYYVLEDATFKAHPAEWGAKLIELYHKWEANVIVGEVNNGGDLVESNLRNCKGGELVPYEYVRASRGKEIRAEPVAGLYERGLVHHVGTFRYLEDQLCTFNPLEGDKSPDRMDGAVWGITKVAGLAEGTFTMGTLMSNAVGEYEDE